MNHKRAGFFVVLYFVQGVAIAYFAGFQKRYLHFKGVDSDWIAILTSLVLLPFILKPIIGLVADSLSVSRKAAIGVGLTLAALSFGAGKWVDPATSFALFGALMILGSVGVAIFDTVADALAVDTFAESDFGSLQSAMLAGKSFGLILFSLIFGFMIDASGYERVFLFLGVSMLVPFLIWRGIENVTRKEIFRWSAFRVLLRTDVVALAVFGVIYSIPSFGIAGLFAYYYSTLGFDASQVGALEAVKSVGSILGALAFSALVRRMSVTKIAVGATLAAVVVSAIVPLNSSLVHFYACMAVFGVIWALRETVFTTLAMRLTSPAIAATMFSLLMAFSNLGTSIGEGWATAAAGRSGFVFTFVLFGLLNLVGLLYFYWQRRASVSKDAAPAA